MKPTIQMVRAMLESSADHAERLSNIALDEGDDLESANYQEDADRSRALAASLDGMVLVPREPTEAQVTRLTNALAWRFKGVMFEDEKVRAAMLAAQEDK